MMILFNYHIEWNEIFIILFKVQFIKETDKYLSGVLCISAMFGFRPQLTSLKFLISSIPFHAFFYLNTLRLKKGGILL